mmetsp:Transcript_11319/g.20466  ORF Transcript_11319/g.20466 Transcript_11319/m.20466 type:complete len:105 (-) Transcript_11319:1099-1413(-)
MSCAFVGGVVVVGNHGGSVQKCSQLVRGGETVVMMANRRNLKREKICRNMAFARQHRKRTGPTRFNRRAVNQENKSADDEFLSSVFTTIGFGEDEKTPDTQNKK